ncbi:BnaC03g34360D [Brassica napus]|uniref:BnaC03g34360D protein n=1 Tax=Brassica napus TaxID=3708 RepID=A0A078HQ59_BRANA|nr:BnaC03g34360D [Brassica napus]
MSYGYDDDSKRKKRYVIISISSVLLISMVVAVTVGVSLNKNEGNGDSDAQITSSVKAVKDVCAPTDFKKTCEDSLNKNGNNTTDPIELVKTAFSATMRQISAAAKKSQTIMELQKDPRTKMALDQCKELMDYALGELSNSFEELGDLPRRVRRDARECWGDHEESVENRYRIDTQRAGDHQRNVEFRGTNGDS